MSKFDSEKDLCLVDLYHNNKEFLECFGNSAQQNKRRKAAWENIANSINSENGTNFTWVQCKKRWQNIKSVSKVSSAANKRSLCKTSSGPPDCKPLSDPLMTLIKFLGETTGIQGEDRLETPLHNEDSHPTAVLNESISSSEMDCQPKPTKIRKKAKISEDDLHEKQLKVLNGQLRELRENAALRVKQHQLIEAQMAATASFMELMQSLKHSQSGQSFQFANDSKQ